MRVLEITRCGFFKALDPDNTCWIQWGSALTADEPHHPEVPRFPIAAEILWRLRKGAYDLVVLPAVHPEHKFDEPWDKLAAKSVLRAAARMPTLAAIVDRLAARHVIVDIADDPRLCKTTMRLSRGNALYFKRELDLDRLSESSRVRPMSLFVPNEKRRLAKTEKDIDVFFAGSICNEVRRSAIRELARLAKRGPRVVIAEKSLDYPEYMRALARSWLVLSPEGYGWDCYRHYEACFARAVPVINRPSYRRPLFLQEGVHCFYYNPDRDSLAELLIAALRNKDRLMRMATAGRRFVLANHTRAAVARYILREIGEAAANGQSPVQRTDARSAGTAGHG